MAPVGGLLELLSMAPMCSSQSKAPNCDGNLIYRRLMDVQNGCCFSSFVASGIYIESPTLNINELNDGVA